MRTYLPSPKVTSPASPKASRESSKTHTISTNYCCLNPMADWYHFRSSPVSELYFLGLLEALLEWPRRVGIKPMELPCWGLIWAGLALTCLVSMVLTSTYSKVRLLRSPFKAHNWTSTLLLQEEDRCYFGVMACLWSDQIRLGMWFQPFLYLL